jgi:hypothetical protein
MRVLVLTVALAIPAVGWGGGRLAAQAVERSDVPGRGMLRVTFDPRVMTWNSEFTDAGRLGLGRGLTGDSVGGANIPTVARLQQDVRVASGLAGFVASLGAGLLSVRQERRTYPVTAELGLSDRLSVSLMVPIVRVATRTALQLSPQGSNLGLNPRLTDPANAAARYQAFFAQLNGALSQLDGNIAAGMYGCPANRRCSAQDSLTAWRAVRDALDRSVDSVGRTFQPFLPRDSSDAGRAIAARVGAMQLKLDTAYGIATFTDALLLPSDTIDGGALETAILIRPTGFGYNGLPFRDSFRYNVGDVEIGAKYRLVAGGRYAAAVAGLVRLPTGATDSADDVLRQSIGDHQTDLEGRLTQELTVGPLWLNLAVRAGVQLPGTRVRRVAPWDALLVPYTATTSLGWKPGDFLGVDVAPLVRLAPQFAVGFTAGYWTKRRDHYSFQSPQDSTALAAQLGVPTPASVLDAGTSERRLRLGFAMTYVGATVEGGFSIEQTVSGAGVVPAATVYRIVMRTSRKLF